MGRKLYVFLFTLTILAVILLTGCSPAGSPAATDLPEETPAATEAAEPQDSITREGRTLTIENVSLEKASDGSVIAVVAYTFKNSQNAPTTFTSDVVETVTWNDQVLEPIDFSEGDYDWDSKTKNIKRNTEISVYTAYPIGDASGTLRVTAAIQADDSISAEKVFDLAALSQE